MLSSLTGVKRPRTILEKEEEEEAPAFSEYSLARSVGRRERQTDRLLSGAASQQEGEEEIVDDSDDEETPTRERWTHPTSGETFVYPLSTFLEPALSGSSAGLPQLVVFRVNHGSAVAPFLEFLVAYPTDGGIGMTWPQISAAAYSEEEALNTGEGQVDEDEREEQDRLRRAAAHLESATSTVFRLVHSVPGDGRQAPRFCGAWSGGGGAAAEYAWFQVDAALVPAGHAWLTVHELVKLGRGPPLTDFQTQPLVWCICDAERMVPVEIPVTMEPLLFRSAGKLSMKPPMTSAVAAPNDQTGEENLEDNDDGGQFDGQFDEQLFAVETNRANYVPGENADTPNNHALFGRTLYAFHDPYWDLFVAGQQTSGMITAPGKEEGHRQYAVFLDKTLFLIGDCARENAALLAYADGDGYSSVYLPTTSSSSSSSSFVWLVQSSDQFALLR